MQDDDKRIGFLILRAFLAQFWVLQFYFKIHDEESGVIALRNVGIWASHIGLKMREALVLGCLIIITLDVGLMLQSKHDDVSRNMVFLFAMLLALQWERYRKAPKRS